MQSFTQLQTIFADLSQNSATNNLTRAAYLGNIEHRYLLLKYFNNETSYSIPTVGGNTYYLTAAPAVGAVSATLAVAWASPTNTISTTFSDGEVRNVLYTNGSTTVTWQIPLVGTTYNLTSNIASGATSAILSSAWSSATQTSTTIFTDGETKSVTYTLNSTAITWVGGLTSTVGNTVQTSVMTTAVSIGGAQFYRLPPNYSKLKTVTITVGNLTWTLNEIRTREEWDRLNVFPYFANIPQSFFIYPGGDHGGKIGIWPIPSSTANTITFNYKFRVPDLSLADVTSTSTLAVTSGSSTVTNSAADWIPTTNAQLESRWIRISTPKGDNLWYQIASVDTTSSLTLYQPYQGITVATGSGTVGQMPLVAEDFQDMLIWKPLVYKFSSIVDNPKKAQEFQVLYDQKLALLNEYSGSNTVQVNLSPKGIGRNPNLFPYSLQG